MSTFLSALGRHRDLLLMLTWRDIRIKYKQSVMGFMWALLMPALIVSAGLIVKLGLATVSGKQLQMSQQAVGGADDAGFPARPAYLQHHEQQDQANDGTGNRNAQGANREIADELADEQHDETGDHECLLAERRA